MTDEHQRRVKVSEFDPEFNYVLVFYWKDGTVSSVNTRFPVEAPTEPIKHLNDRRITKLLKDYPDLHLAFVNETRELDHVEVVSNV